jgi:ABC-type polysaccharide/polyol phosphate transport system ATPase subunit
MVDFPTHGSRDAHMTDVAIRLTSVSKRFRLYDNPVTGPIKEYLFFWKRRKEYRDYLAVNNVSLEIPRGQVVGILGPNGAGKTTLLKMIAGLLPVDSGKIEVHGKVTALLALGVGINPECSGRENAVYNGLLLGMSKQEVLASLPAIVEFSELGSYIDMPFRTYSSGMKARLLFAVSMSIKPDILIVDEALATGDSYFVNKALRKIDDMCRSGATILFVSHHTAQIQRLCQKAYLMIDGGVAAHGEPAAVIETYNRWTFEKEMRSPFISQNQGIRPIGGTGQVQISAIHLRNAQGQEGTGFFTGEKMTVSIHYRSTLPSGTPANLFVGFLLARDGTFVGQFNTFEHLNGPEQTTRTTALELDKEGVIELAFDPLLLLNNHYSLWVMVYGPGHTFCEVKNVSPFFIALKRHCLNRDAIFWQPGNLRRAG